MAKKKETVLTPKQKFFMSHLLKQTNKFAAAVVPLGSDKLTEQAVEVRDRILEVYQSDQARQMMARILSPLLGCEIDFPVAQQVEYTKYSMIVLTSNPNDNSYSLGKPYLVIQEGDEIKRAIDANGKTYGSLPEKCVASSTMRVATAEEVEKFVISLKDAAVEKYMPDLMTAFDFVQEQLTA